MQNWTTELYTEARQAGLFDKNKKQRPYNNNQLYRCYFLTPDGEYGNTVFCAEVQYEDIYESKVSVERSVKQAKKKFNECSPPGTEILRLEVAETGSIKSKQKVMQ